MGTGPDRIHLMLKSAILPCDIDTPSQGVVSFGSFSLRLSKENERECRVASRRSCL